MDIKMSAFWYWGATKGLWYRSYTSGGGIYTGRDLISGIHTIVRVLVYIGEVPR